MNWRVAVFALAVLSAPAVFGGLPLQAQPQSGDVSTVVSVPLADGDSATVTGVLAVRHRGGQQFLVLQSPTPYSLVHDHQAGEHSGKLVRDMPIHLKGRDAELMKLNGSTLTAKGRLMFEPAETSWNGALLESSVVVLPNGKELHAKR